MKQERNTVIQECIEVVEKLIHSYCNDHTPFRGPCCSCGNYDNPDILDPEETIKTLKEMKTK